MSEETQKPDFILQKGNFETGYKKTVINNNGTIGVVGKANHSVINVSNVEHNDISKLIEEIGNELVKKYANASEIEKQIVLKMEIERNLSLNPDIKKRFLNALKSGGSELTKVLINNPFVTVSLETVKGWFEV